MNVGSASTPSSAATPGSYMRPKVTENPPPPPRNPRDASVYGAPINLKGVPIGKIIEVVRDQDGIRVYGIIEGGLLPLRCTCRHDYIDCDRESPGCVFRPLG